MFRLPVVGIIASILVTCSRSSPNATEWQERVLPCPSVDISVHLKDVENSTQIIIPACPERSYELVSDVLIADVTDLHIVGSQAITTINCTRANVKMSFEGISNLRIENLRVLNCGTKEKTCIRTGGVNIVNCSNVTIRGVTIELSQRTGLTLVNTSGQVTIENSTFLKNGKTLERTAPSGQSGSSFTEFYDRGGGMQVLMTKHQEKVFLTVTDCEFSNNSAHHGGGVFLLIPKKEEMIDIMLQIVNTTFDQNNCFEGGGGLAIGFGDPNFKYAERLFNNNAKITIENCTFSSNRAKYGGGVAIFSTLGPFRFSSDTLTFTRCTWRNNSAVLGLAVDIALSPEATFNMHRHLPSPVFADCEFIENKDESVYDSSFIVNKPRSVLFVTGFTVVFRGETTFRNNSGSAIEATAAILDFEANSSASFVNNKAIEGGAWNIQALTTVYIHDDSHFLFENNVAMQSGGAIFAPFADKHSLFLSRSCFIQHETEPKNVTFEFRNNMAGAVSEKGPPNYLKKDQDLRHRGDSFWFTSLSLCTAECISSLTFEPVPISSALMCIGNVTFDRLHPERRQISTAANHFASTDQEPTDDNMCTIHVNVSNNTVRRNPNFNPSEVNPITGTLHLIPGKTAMVPLRLVDDLCAEIFFLVRVQVISSDQNMYVDPAHSVITDNRITLYGDENQRGRVQLTTLGIRAITVTIDVFMDSCPPGFVHNSSVKACICSATNNTTKYPGIDRCDEFEALFQHGYWVGYLGYTSENSLATAICPKGFCFNSTKATKDHRLPSNAIDDISAYICNANRTGRVCGKCKENHSAYYNSMAFVCKSNDLCHLGWMFYVLSELVPVTLLFLIVIAFNISFTSGPLNGVIFFMQIVDTLKVKAENFIWFIEPVYEVTFIHKLVYRMFSLNFFSLERLSFCLWSGASALDLLAFKYVTIVYSLLLIIGTVALLKVCSFKFCDKYSINLKGSIIHGLSAFLVMSYSECTRVSLMIMTRGTLTIGPSMSHVNKYFAFYNGEFMFMGPAHLKYALPAIFFIMTLVSIPPLILFSYPLCYKLFALLRIEESKCVHITCKILPLEKIKPLFDSIQSAFKDRYRFFSGLYFLYRLSSLATFSIAHTLTIHYTVTGFQLVCMLTLHATCRPYKKSWHNVLDACLFFNLFLINGLAYFNYYLATTYENQETTIQCIAAFQTGLILLPLVYLTAYTSYRLIMKLKSACANKCSVFRQAEGDETDDGQVLYAIDSRDIDESFEERSRYQLLKQEQHRKQEQEGSKV